MVLQVVKISGLSKTHGEQPGVIKVISKCQETEATTAVLLPKPLTQQSK